MRDTTIIPRPYFREGTDALASLVATRPARDVLLNVAAELVHRERPAARRLAAEVAALLGGVASIGQACEPVAMPAPAHDVTIWPNGAPTLGTPDSEMRDDPAPVTAKPARKPAARAAKRPGDIGWKPRSLDQIARTAGLAPLSWDADTLAVCGGNGLLAHREHGLMARGFERGGPAGDGCTTWKRGADRILVGPYGALYLADGTMRQLPREERDAITEDGRAGIAAAVVAERLRVKRAAARAKARVAWIDAKQNRTAKLRADAPQWLRDGAKAKVALAWKLRAEARAI
jgi:hypothetical protein